MAQQPQQAPPQQQHPQNPGMSQPSAAYQYPPQHQQYPPTSHEMPPQGYSHPNGAMYAQPRPDWGGYGGHGAPITPGGHPAVYGHAQGHQRPSQVYSFVPIPGAQQHKRPRRRYEEIERMYKCGYQGCEKAYGTLNHLNAHVTMQSHGLKRTPEEFKEIRKEWKARKKEEQTVRKAEEERQRQAVQAQVQNGSDPDGTPTSYSQGRTQVTLPPIGYAQGSQYQASPVPVTQQPMSEYQGHMYQNYGPPQSPYGQTPQQNVPYQQPNGQPNQQPPNH